MQINSATLNILRRSFRTLAALGQQQATPRWPMVAMMAPSSTAENTYGWLKDIPGMREWVGDRVLQNLSEAEYTVRNKPFELTVSVKRDHIEDDNLGVYSPMFSALGSAVAYSPDEIIFDLLIGGFGIKCWDGKSFFAGNHPVKKGVVASNIGSKKLAASSFEEALAQMQGLKNAADQSLRVFMGEGQQAPLLVVSPKYRATARRVVGAEKVNGGEDNVNLGAARIMVLPEMAGVSDDAWFLLDSTFPVKPLIYQQRKAPEFVALDNPDDPNVFHKREYVYGYDDRKAAGFGFWQLAYGSDGTTNP
ncbi:MAG: Mu-like prophage major head subunit gpT family protein [Meiothermus sp.]|nr:Mu-like prophage major head subunit gpT family protein [Meiothermus sp.]